MNEMRFSAEIMREDGVVPVAVVNERRYGGVRVKAEWPPALDTPEIRVELKVRGDVDRRDAPAYVELFFHDLFLLLNLAAPRTFGGTVSVSGPGELRVRELVFSPRVFAYASDLQRLPLDRVVAWYDQLGIGTKQVASSGAPAALFQLLHLARGEENEEESIVRLAGAAEALGLAIEPRLFALRDEIARGRTPVFHPMHDDALDPHVEDATREWIEVTDAAAGAVIRELQGRIGKER